MAEIAKKVPAAPAGKRRVLTEAERRVRDEEKASRFVKLVNVRMGKTLTRLAQIKALTNKSVYSYTDSQAKQILDALQAAVNSIRDGFAGTKEMRSGFHLF